MTAHAAACAVSQLNETSEQRRARRIRMGNILMSDCQVSRTQDWLGDPASEERKRVAGVRALADSQIWQKARPVTFITFFFFFFFFFFFLNVFPLFHRLRSRSHQIRRSPWSCDAHGQKLPTSAVILLSLRLNLNLRSIVCHDPPKCFFHLNNSHSSTNTFDHNEGGPRDLDTRRPISKLRLNTRPVKRADCSRQNIPRGMPLCATGLSLESHCTANHCGSAIGRTIQNE